MFYCLMCSITTHSNKRGVISWIILSHFRLCFFSPLMGGNHIQTYFSSLHNFPYHSLRIDCIVIVTSVVVDTSRCASQLQQVSSRRHSTDSFVHRETPGCRPCLGVPSVRAAARCSGSAAVSWPVSNNSTVFTVHILHTTMASPAADIGEVTHQHILQRSAPTLLLPATYLVYVDICQRGERS